MHSYASAAFSHKHLHACACQKSNLISEFSVFYWAKLCWFCCAVQKLHAANQALEIARVCRDMLGGGDGSMCFGEIPGV